MDETVFSVNELCLDGEQLQSDHDDLETLNKIVDIYKENVKEGVTLPAATIGKIAVEQLMARLNYPMGKQYVSLEAYGTLMTRGPATRITMENLTESLNNVWTKILEKLKEFLKRVFNHFGELRRENDYDKAKEFLKNTDSNIRKVYNDAHHELKTVRSSLTYGFETKDRQCNPETTLMFLNNTDVFLDKALRFSDQYGNYLQSQMQVVDEMVRYYETETDISKLLHLVTTGCDRLRQYVESFSAVHDKSSYMSEPLPFGYQCMIESKSSTELVPTEFNFKIMKAPLTRSFNQYRFPTKTEYLRMTNFLESIVNKTNKLLHNHETVLKADGHRLLTKIEKLKRTHAANIATSVKDAESLEQIRKGLVKTLTEFNTFFIKIGDAGTYIYKTTIRFLEHLEPAPVSEQ